MMAVSISALSQKNEIRLGDELPGDVSMEELMAYGENAVVAHDGPFKVGDALPGDMSAGEVVDYAMSAMKISPEIVTITIEHTLVDKVEDGKETKMKAGSPMAVAEFTTDGYFDVAAFDLRYQELSSAYAGVGEKAQPGDMFVQEFCDHNGYRKIKWQYQCIASSCFWRVIHISSMTHCP